jgi:hypothetical protein
MALRNMLAIFSRVRVTGRRRGMKVPPQHR